jgi:single-stranded DNA-binding protein
VNTRQGQNGEYKTIMFSLAVDRNLTKEQKAKAKNDSSIQTVDFIPLSASNSKIVDFIEQWMPVGRAAIVDCHYETYKKTNQQTGQTEYGHTFRVDSINFSVADAKSLQNNANGNNYNNNNHNNSNNNSGNNSNNGFSMFDEEETYDASLEPDIDQAF